MFYIDTSINSAVQGRARFDIAKFVQFIDGAFDPANAYMLQAVLSLPVAGEYAVRDDVSRPDLISAAIYKGDPQYWWLLLLYNNLWGQTSPYLYPSVPFGTVLRFFALADLERLYFSLRARQLGQVPASQAV